MEQQKFVMEALEAESMAQSLGLPSVHHLLPALVHPAQLLSRPPISNYHVAAVGLGVDGRVYVGVNLEFPGLPLHHSIHAEQFLIANLAAHGCPGLLFLAVSASPCGNCRQLFQELRGSSSLQILIITQSRNSGHDVTFRPLSEFLPNPFGPCDLLDDDTPLLLELHNNGLSLCDNMCEKNDLLRSEALAAANESHAPYSRCPSGVALMDCEGKVYKGCYVESAAYNPSVGPVQAALIAFVGGGGGGYERIAAAALVEKEDAKMRQEDTAALLLNKLSPNCVFKVFYCCSSDAKVYAKTST